MQLLHTADIQLALGLSRAGAVHFLRADLGALPGKFHAAPPNGKPKPAFVRDYTTVPAALELALFNRTALHLLGKYPRDPMDLFMAEAIRRMAERYGERIVLLHTGAVPTAA